jgi:3-oxoacyl-[acyl-carrier-protein] synthase-1
VARHLGRSAPAISISTACSSGAMALATARRLLRAGLADAVIAGAADSLCKLTVNGFQALSALSPGICNPFSRRRDGTTIGEGASIFLVENRPSDIALLGVGCSADAYSMTAPEPEAVGVKLAMRAALDDAGIDADGIDYIQLHGTGTVQNDAMESKAVLDIFGPRVRCSSSKGQTGHALGAAGALSVAHCWLAASETNADGALPPHLWDGDADDGLLSESLVSVGEGLPASSPRVFMSNVFAFGGSNACLVIGRGA